MECGFAGGTNIVRFGIGPTMKWVRFGETAPSVE
jgi:hypothetical protein